MKTITLTLSLDDTNQILDALGSRPYSEVFQLITKIQQQAAGQMQPVDFEPPAAPSEQGGN